MKSTTAVVDELTPPVTNGSTVRKKIWIDLDNSPHVPFFVPIIPELKARGYDIFLTARDSYQVVELLKHYKVDARVIGKHYGKHKILKVLGTLWRGVMLTFIVRKEKPTISVTHGSRGCSLASAFLKIPNVIMMDYEHTNKGMPAKNKDLWLIFPEIIPTDGDPYDKILKYPGIKEDVYLPTFHPDPRLRANLGIGPDELLVTVRPPATEAHYHNPEAEGLLTATFEKFVNMPGARILLLPRNKRQEAALRADWGKFIDSGKIVIPAHVEDGMNIIWNSDLVVSGGGTMNREAAAMGVPVYSIFRGPIGAVDKFLASKGRLVMIENVEQVSSKINPVRRDKNAITLKHQKSAALEAIVGHVIRIAETAKGHGEASSGKK
jgi:predicted glycosyltransferase